ncbi:hypothetical protein GALMADRAFT_155537 [Galerina marginata CBS 339.88]|uniref:Uncharacterized protein n=1 Tax=Galerina marginata (strain CBS 339.88) TaxID=685588 RepID=A0A067TCY5_GALM3|nr:hypothetical protein GALMADRAFT_155537 [Galerina marginata CBS 339.88]
MSPNTPKHDCDAKALDWALFAFTIISTHVTWWLLPLPTLFTRGFRIYIHDVAWESLRLQVPSFVAYQSCFKQERSHWQMCYFSGVASPSTRLRDLKAIFKDSFIVVSTVLALYRLSKGGKADKDLSGINSSLWNYPSLPVAIFGLSISIFSRTKVKGWIISLLTITIIVIIGAAIAVVIALTYGHGMWVWSTVLMIYMGLPLWAFVPRLIVLSAILSALARMGGPIIGAVSPNAYFPFCALRGWGFAGPLLALGIVNCFLGLYAITLVPRTDDSPPPSLDVEMSEK